MDDTEKIANSITKGIAYTENGGKPDISNPKTGSTGEAKSIFQYTPATWKRYAKEITGNEDIAMNADTETYITNEKVKQWIKKGYTAKQIASVWNAGESEKNAYTGKFSDGSLSVGLNKKYGNVKFDVPSYADKVQKYSKQFYHEKNSPPVNVPQPNVPQTNTQSGDFLGKQ